MSFSSENTHFILVRPEYAGNVGAAARAIKNFGFKKIRLVAPWRDYLEADDKWMAVEAYDLLQQATTFLTLEEALSDIAVAVATSSSRLRSTPFQKIEELLPELGGLSTDNKIAFVFGNERQGLTREELLFCHHTLTIDTSPEFPVLNLAQSICLVAYECSRTAKDDDEDSRELTRGSEDDRLFTQIEELLNSISFTREHNHKLVLTELRSCFKRAHATPREVSLLRGILHRIELRLSSKQSNSQ